MPPTLYIFGSGILSAARRLIDTHKGEGEVRFGASLRGLSLPRVHLSVIESPPTWEKLVVAEMEDYIGNPRNIQGDHGQVRPCRRAHLVRRRHEARV